MVHTWDKDYVKYAGHDIEPVHIILLRSEAIDKFHLVKIIYNAISKTLLYHCKDPEKRAFLPGPTGISEKNMSRTTIHLSLGNLEQSYLV